MTECLDEDGFKIVLSKRRKCGRPQRVKQKIASLAHIHNELISVDPKFVMQTLKAQKHELCSSNFCTTALSTIVSNCNGLKDIVCYGLGNFSLCKNSSYQLALLLILQKELNCNVSIFDPVFYEPEKEILRKLGFSISKNDECHRKVEVNTLFYMIHCGKPLYNNILYANWNAESLSKVMILGNSFQHMQLVNTKPFLSTKLKYINAILPHLTEFKLPNTFMYEDIFNNTSLHLFNAEELLNFNSNLWCLCDEPEYDSDDEIIRNVSNLKI